MSGIPVYTSSPINAAKAAGVTPKTATPQEQTSTPLTAVPATTTATSTSSYPPAQPGAAAFPGPTAAAPPPIARYVPLQPTPTTQYSPEGPPAPQPGAIPTPLNRTTIPPPPKAGEKYTPAQQTAAPTTSTRAAQPYPAQMSIPPPTSTYGGQPPSSSTATTNTASIPYPVAIPTSEYGSQRRSFEHPPGYQQNVYASDLTSEQRRAQELHNSSSSGSQNNSEAVGGLDAESVWNTAKKWAQQAGEKMSAAEAEVWRKINKE